MYSACWDLPGGVGSGGDVDHYANLGVMPVWSVKPRNTTNCGPNGSPGVYGNGFAYESIGGVAQSGWKTVEDGAMDHHTVTVGGVGVDYGLVPILQQLEAVGEHYKMPIGLAVSHEPHSAATDYGKCSGLGDGTNTCQGSAAEFVSMYAHLRSLLGAGDQNYPHIRLFYIGVDSNLTQKTGNGTTCTSSSPVGCADIMRPAQANYDVIGADSYNYYHYMTGNAYRLATYSGKLGNVMALAAETGVQKQVYATEIGTHPGCPNGGTDTIASPTYGAGCLSTDTPTDNKNQWFADLASAMTTNSTYEQWFEGFQYFNEAPTDSSGAFHDWEYVNKSNPTENNDLSCPTPSSPSNCWDGNSSGNGYLTSFINGTDSTWFLPGGANFYA